MSCVSLQRGLSHTPRCRSWSPQLLARLHGRCSSPSQSGGRPRSPSGCHSSVPPEADLTRSDWLWRLLAGRHTGLQAAVELEAVASYAVLYDRLSERRAETPSPSLCTLLPEVPDLPPPKVCQAMGGRPPGGKACRHRLEPDVVNPRDVRQTALPPPPTNPSLHLIKSSPRHSTGRPGGSVVALLKQRWTLTARPQARAEVEHQRHH